MKVEYTTTRETAVLLKELAGNIGSSPRSIEGVMASTARALLAEREKPVETFMNGVVDVKEITGEAVLKSFVCGRNLRAKTIAKFSPTISVREI